MSTALTHSLLGGVPLAVLLVLVALIFRHKGPHPATYKMSDPWDRAPILWASEEPTVHGHHTGTGHGAHPVTIGGGASGKW